MAVLTFILAVACVVLVLALLGVLHFRTTRGQTEISLEHARVGRALKDAFARCRQWVRGKPSSQT